MQDTPHYHGHRKRLRARFRKTGFEGFQDYEALELLLTFSIPRKDTKPIAKELMNKFGSIRGVMDATYDELSASNGLGENAATFVRMIKECSALYLKDGIKGKKKISSTGALLEYCQVAMSGLKDEQFRAIFLSTQNEVIADEVVHDGIVNQSIVYPRKVMERALYHKATAIIFVHNHPGGSCKPSKEDIALTTELVEAAKSLQLTVHDHLIVSGRGYYSFLEHGLM